MKHHYLNESVRIRRDMRKSLNESSGQPRKIFNYIYGGRGRTHYYIVTPVAVLGNVNIDYIKEMAKHFERFDRDVVAVMDDSGNLATFGFEFDFTKPYDPKDYAKRFDAITDKIIEYCDENDIEYELDEDDGFIQVMNAW